MFAVTGLAITLFLGGWQAPFPFLNWVPSWIWFFAKLSALVALLIWIRGTLPRLRMDQLMSFAWKFMLPMALLNLLVAALWFFMPSGPARWAVCLFLLLGPYYGLARGLAQTSKISKRIYQYAE